MENLQTTSYQFKISVTLREYPQSIVYLEKIINFISEYSYEEIEILNRLSNELLMKSTKLLTSINAILSNSVNSFNNIKYHNRIVLDNYSKHIYSNSLDLIKRLLLCLDKITVKLIEEPSKALCSKMIGKLNAFLSVYCSGYGNQSNYLESALNHYKQAVELSIEYLSILDPLRLRILLSYCKFVVVYMKDYYRSMLFCMNIIEEIHTNIGNLKENKNDEECEKKIQVRLGKFKRFYEENTIEYNKTVLKYFK